MMRNGVATVVRRNWCEPPGRGSSEWTHRTFVQVLGLDSCTDGIAQLVEEEFEKRSYKKISSTNSSIIFEQVFYAPKQSLNREPMMECVTKILGILRGGGFGGGKGICSSATQNGDGSSTTTWTVYGTQ